MHGADDLVIAGAAAEVAGKAEADLGLRSGPGCARAAPWRRSGSPACRCRIASAACSRNLRCSGCSSSPSAMPSMVSISAAFGLGAEHQAGADEPAVDRDAAGAAVAGAAAFLRAGQAQAVAQHVEQRLVGLADEFDGVAVDRGCDMNARHLLSSCALARDLCGAARQHAGDLDSEFAWCRACRRSAGRRPSRPRPALRAPPRRACVPISAFAASGTSRTVGATAPERHRAHRCRRPWHRASG